MVMEVKGRFSNTPRQQLRNLLDKVVMAGRSDVYDFSGGHLNEANLYKPPEVVSHKPWKSAKRTDIKLVGEATPRMIETSPIARRERMKATLANFSLGTAGNFPFPLLKYKTSPRQVRSTDSKSNQSDRGSANELDCGNDRAKQSQKSSVGNMLTYVDDHVFAEELDLSEMMLTRINIRGAACTTATDVRHSLQHDFLAGHMGGITKKDQFVCMKKFESHMGKQDASDGNVIQGLGVVEYLENKLRQRLHGLQRDVVGPYFHRLQIYSSIFGDVVEESKTFGFILRKIKCEYDAYIASLLDTPTGEHRILCDQVDHLIFHTSANPTVLKLEQERVSELQQEAREMLEENERLRQAVRDKMNQPVEPEPDLLSMAATKPEGTPTQDIVTIIDDLRARILEKLDAVKLMRATLRQDYVPSTVCTHVEQCIKETEVEFQRLKSNKNYFEGNNNEMEKDLQEAIENADTTERDQRRLWKRIIAVKTGETRTYSDDEQDDESKWDWYIS